jgi:hypothetical protein
MKRSAVLPCPANQRSRTVSNFYLSDVFEDVSEEGQRAREKFGSQADSTDERWLAILMEEAGEAATEVLRVGNPGLDALLKRSNQTGIPLDDADLDPRIRLRKEIVQVAAVAMRWVQSLDVRMEAGK